MSSEIRPEDIEAAIAAAEQRRRARMGGAAMGAAAMGGGADVATAPPPAGRRPVMPERVTGGSGADAAAREPAKPGASARVADDLDDSWLDQPVRPRPATNRVANLPESEVVWEPETSRRGLTAPFAIAAAVLLLFGSVLWWFYSSGGEPDGGEVPVIVAEEMPIKEKPAEEGGLEVPDQDKLVYNNIAEGEDQTAGVEQLLPAPEEPVAPPQPDATAAAAAATTGTAQPAPLTPTDEDTEAAMADAALPPDALDVPVSAPATTPPAAVEPPAPAATAAEAPATAAPATQQAAVPAPAAPAAPAVAPAEPVQPAAASGWKIQLAAVKSEQAARQEWGRMQKAHPDLLGDMRLTVQRADLGDKGVFFRIQGGPLPDRTTAEDVCAELKSTKQPCLVVKP